jgi:hypothetical protein
MNKEQKRAFVKAALSGDRETVEGILKANEDIILVLMQQPDKYCTYQQPCECVNPQGCIYLKTETELRAVYKNATFIVIQNPVKQRNELVKLKNKLQNEK